MLPQKKIAYQDQNMAWRLLIALFILAGPRRSLPNTPPYHSPYTVHVQQSSNNDTWALVDSVLDEDGMACEHHNQTLMYAGDVLLLVPCKRALLDGWKVYMTLESSPSSEGSMESHPFLVGSDVHKLHDLEAGAYMVHQQHIEFGLQIRVSTLVNVFPAEERLAIIEREYISSATDDLDKLVHKKDILDHSVGPLLPVSQSSLLASLFNALRADSRFAAANATAELSKLLSQTYERKLFRTTLLGLQEEFGIDLLQECGPPRLRLSPLIDLPGMYPSQRWEDREDKREFQMFSVVPDAIREYLSDLAPLTLLDIGANFGIWSLFAAGRSTVQVHSFEPHPLIFEVLRSNVDFLKLSSQVTVSPLAFSNHSGEGQLNIAQSAEWFVPRHARTHALTHAPCMFACPFAGLLARPCTSTRTRTFAHARHETAWHGMAWHGMPCHAMPRHHTAQPCTARRTRLHLTAPHCPATGPHCTALDRTA